MNNAEIVYKILTLLNENEKPTPKLLNIQERSFKAIYNNLVENDFISDADRITINGIIYLNNVEMKESIKNINNVLSNMYFKKNTDIEML